MTRVIDGFSNDVIDGFSNDLLDKVIVDMPLVINSSFSPVITQLGFYQRVTMQFRFRVMCQTYFFGEDCYRFCISHDSDTVGHFTCDVNGNQVCLPGFTGVDCLTSEY